MIGCSRILLANSVHINIISIPLPQPLPRIYLALTRWRTKRKSFVVSSFKPSPGIRRKTLFPIGSKRRSRRTLTSSSLAKINWGGRKCILPWGLPTKNNPTTSWETWWESARFRITITPKREMKRRNSLNPSWCVLVRVLLWARGFKFCMVLFLTIEIFLKN